MANVIETGIYKDRLPPAKIKLGIVIERAPAGAWYNWLAYVGAPDPVDPGAYSGVTSGGVYGQGDTKEEALYELFDAIAGKWADEGE